MAILDGMLTAISTKKLKAKLTPKDRAILLCDLNTTLEWDGFDIGYYDKNISELPYEEEKALELKRSRDMIRKHDRQNKD